MKSSRFLVAGPLLLSAFGSGDALADSERMLVRGYHTWILDRLPYVRHTAVVDCAFTEW